MKLIINPNFIYSATLSIPHRNISIFNGSSTTAFDTLLIAVAAVAVTARLFLFLPRAAKKDLRAV